MSASDPVPWSEVIITGGMGFIGSNLARSLVERDVTVHIIDAELPEYGANRANISDVESEVDIHTFDIRDQERLKSLFEKIQPAAVFHLAAQLSRPISVSDPLTDVDINCTGTINVLEAVKDHCPDASVLFTSSQAVYGVPESLPLTEKTETSPIDIYGANKLAGEKYCDVYTKVHGIDIKTIRLTNVYGPRAQLDNPKYGVINKFIRNAITDTELPVYKPGTMLRDFVFIDDVISAILAITSDGESGDTYLVGSGTSTSIKELAQTIVDRTGSGEVTMVDWPDDWGGIRVGDITIETEKATTTTEWEPETTLLEGVDRTVEYYSTHLEQYLSPET